MAGAGHDGGAGSCPLCGPARFPFYITFCSSHPDTPLVVSTEHREEFTSEQREMIERLFPGRRIRWEQRSIPEHAHCHVEG